MSRHQYRSIPFALAMLSVAGAAHADTRSSQAIPVKSSSDKQGSAQSKAFDPQGPKNGMPEQAQFCRNDKSHDEHSRCHRNDSEG